MKLNTTETVDKAWHLVKLMEADYGEKMVVCLLKIELLSTGGRIDECEYYSGKFMPGHMICADQSSTQSNDPNNRT